MRIICAWCQLLMCDGPAFPVSHGMCPACEAKFNAEVLAGR